MPDRAALEAVLFDAGGTLGRLDFEWMAATARERGAALDAATLRAAEVEGRRRYDASVGYAPVVAGSSPPLGAVGDIVAYLAGMLEAAGVPAAVVPALVETYRTRQAGPGLWSRSMDGAAEMLALVQAMGLRSAVVSNSDGRAEAHVRAWGLLEHVEFVVDSHLVGIEKPDPRIFEIALRRLGLTAERVLFVGDIRSVDEAGARAAELHFVLLDPSGGYVAPGGPAIREIAELPGWIARHFDCPIAGAFPAGVRRGGGGGGRASGRLP